MNEPLYAVTGATGNTGQAAVKSLLERGARVRAMFRAGDDRSAALATAVTMKVFPTYAVSLATGGMTFLILVFGEVFPKSIATRNNIMTARMTIYPIYWLSVVFFPILLFLNFIPRLTGKIRQIPTATEKELMTFVDVVEEEGEIKEEERNLIYNVFEFDDTHASEIMTPRADMFIIDADEPLDLKVISQSGFVFWG